MSAPLAHAELLNTPSPGNTSSLHPLSWHPPAHALIQAARNGDESLFLVGPPGSGKSELLRYYADGYADLQEDAEDNLLMPASDIRMVLLGRARHPGAMFAAIMHACRQEISPRLQRKRPSVVLSHVADWLAKSDVRLLVLDEVQHASPEALFHAMLLTDACVNEHRHQLSLALIGTPEARRTVEDTAQLGQRVPVLLQVPLLEAEEITELLQSQAESGAMLRRLGVRKREHLLNDIALRSVGSIRRLERMRARAEWLAREIGEALSEEHWRIALDLQAD